MKRLAPRVSGKRVLIALAAVLAFALASALRYYGHYHPFADLLHVSGESLSQTGLRIGDATVTGRTNGKLRWRVKARQITLSADRSLVTAQGIHDGVLYGSTGTPLFTLSAGRATYQKPTGSIGASNAGGALTLDGGITGSAVRAGGPTLRAPALVWDAGGGLVRSAGPTTALFPAGARAIGGLRLQAPLLVWDTSRAVLRAPGTTVAVFPDGVSRVQGDDIEVDTVRGDLSLRHLHGTFRVPGSLH